MKEQIKQTITKGEAVDIADAELYNDTVKRVDYSGNQPRHQGSEIYNKAYKPKKETVDRSSLNNKITCDNIRGWGDNLYQRLYVDGDRYGEGVRVVGYSSYVPERNSKGDRRPSEQSGFSIYFDDEQQVIEFAQKCLDTMAIKKEREYLFKQYDGTHPDVYNHFPNMLDRTMCETGRYYWDASLNKVVEITEDTDAEILELHPEYRTDDEGNFEQSWTNEKAEDKLKGLLRGQECNWTGDDYMDINLANLQTGGYYTDGLVARKVRNPEDKRRKMWLTTFFFVDGTETTLEGKWDLLGDGTLRRLTWKE